MQQANAYTEIGYSICQTENADAANHRFLGQGLSHLLLAYPSRVTHVEII